MLRKTFLPVAFLAFNFKTVMVSQTFILKSEKFSVLLSSRANIRPCITTYLTLSQRTSHLYLFSCFVTVRTNTSPRRCVRLSTAKLNVSVEAAFRGSSFTHKEKRLLKS